MNTLQKIYRKTEADGKTYFFVLYPEGANLKEKTQTRDRVESIAQDFAEKNGFPKAVKHRGNDEVWFEVSMTH